MAEFSITPRGDEAAARAVLDALPDARFRLRRDGTCVDVASGGYDLRIAPERCLGRRLDELLPADVAEHLLVELRTAIDERRVTTTEYVLTLGGDERWHETRIVPFGDEAIAIVRDVTARVLAEQAARAHLRLAESAFLAIADAVVVVDTDGAVQRVNRQFELMLGLDASEVQGLRPPYPWWPEDARTKLEQRVRGVLDGSVIGYTTTFRRRDGECFPAVVTAAPMSDEHGARAGAVATVRDVSEQQRAERRLGEVQRWVDGIVAALDEHLYAGSVDPDGTYHELYCGPNLERLLGRPITPGEDTADAWIDAVHPDDREAYRAAHAALATGERLDLEYRMVDPAGHERWVHDRAQPRAAAGDEPGVVIDGIVADVTERRQSEDELLRALAELNETAAELELARSEAERLARTDPLTGCHNRRYGRELLTIELRRARRNDTHVGVLMLDIDHFKAVNDTYGHQAGDDVLVAVANRLASAVRPYDCVVRWGGEEFVIVLPEIASEATLVGIADGLRRIVAETPIVATAGHVVPITVSLGAVLSGEALPSIERLVDAADQALYAAKEGGRDQVELHREPEASRSV